MDERNRQYLSGNMDDDVRTQTLGETRFQERPFGSDSQTEVIPPRKAYTSLWLFSETNPFRVRCKAIVDSKPFDYFILLTIFANCILLAMNTPLPNEDKSITNERIESAEIYLLVIFGIECILKVIAFGFLLHPGSYLRSGWNMLDFVVVVTGFLSLPELQLGINAGSLKALRAARVLRPLKLVSGIPSLQVVMKSIMCAISPLLQICLLVGFVVVLYAIIGLQFLNGAFHYVCIENNGTAAVPDEPQICAAPDKGGLACPSGSVCKPDWEGPNDGITNFDNVFLGMLTVFQVITNEGWTDIMYWTFDALDDNAYFFWFLYYSLVVIGSFFMLNLVLGVLSGEFAKERERVENRKAFLKVRRSEQVERQVTGYLDWLSKAEDILMEEEENGDEGMEYERYEGGVAMTSDVLARRRHKTQKDEGFWKNFPRRNKRWRVKVRHIVKHQAFYWTVITCVFLNTVSVALLHYKQPDWLTQMQDTAETVFLTFFFVEMCLKIYGLGFQIYFNSQFNRFDFVIVWCSILEYILSKAEGMNLGISVLRALRLLRLFKFTRYWSSLRNLITSLLGSIKSILSLLFLLFLFIVIFALLGMQLFGAQFKKVRDENPRTNFDDFWNAMLSVFQILTGEDWNAVMYDGVVASGGPHSVVGLASSLYFVLLVILGNYTLLNVFLAIAVDNLANAQQLNEDEEAEEQAREERKREIKAEFERRIRNGHAINTAVEIDGRRTDGPREAEFEQEDDGELRPANLVRTMQNPERIVPQPSENAIIDTKTFFIFSPTNPIRIVAHRIVNFRHFDNGILVCILISSVLLACEDVVNEEATINKVLTYFDYVFTTIFAFEVVVKMIDYGVVLHKGSYLRSGWNFIDALVVSSAIASLVLASNPDSSPSAQKVVKLLRVLRVLRPLKAVNKSRNLKAVFQCIVFSLKNVMNILLITILFLFIFACIGVQLFQGKFFMCNDVSKMTEEECQGSYYAYSSDLSDINKPEKTDREWGKHDWHFDNVLYAMSTLFASSTGEGWPAVMQAAIDATDIDRGPITNNQIEVALYFILFVVIFSFFFINIFVALIILTFQDEKEKEQGDCELERNQRDCLHIAIIKKPIQRFMPDNPNSPQYRVWQVVDSAPFEYFIMLLIVLNTLTMMMKYYNEPAIYRTYLDRFNEVFTFLFTLEAVLKLYVFRVNYFRDGWNCFDFVIVLGSLLDFILTHGTSGALPFDVSMFRLFRAARLVKLLKRGYTIRILLWTFLQSFKSLPYVGIMIGLLFFIYAIIGMQLFGKVATNQGELDKEKDGSDIWGQIAPRNNFRSFFPAIQVLFRSATGENWHYIMLACSSEALCTEDAVPKAEKGATCGSDITYLYFISFVFLCSFLMLNLFVAVIMDNFEYLTRDESILGPHHLDEFVRVWAEFDPAATGRIKHTEVCQLLRQMVPPVGIGMKCPKIVAYKRLIKMNMPLDSDGTVEFTATLFALVRTALGVLTDNNNLKKNDKEMQALLKRVWPKLTKNTLDKIMPKPPRNAGAQQMTVGKIYCAKLIYENYKFLKRKGDAQDGGNLLGRFVGGNGYRNHSQDIERGEDIPMRSVHRSVTPTDTTSHRSLPPSLLSQSRHSRTSLSSSPVPRTGSTGDSGVSENGYHPNMNQHIAMAIRSGKSPYAIYGLQEVDDGDDWC
ncbi:voltage-dependent R-type calcium channel subunit alpha-1E-like [Dendronephthya gigantea]|uniref:voltage-dependent R-type calcium channel subunit alpha-1E-like n=1 Tax=Dendronephthya gigantea TaxID=151771 RepID=UPI00106ACF4A|nr:voltage-dependent R-type calcium channel subunit alpha-1E-like [Dendronephthya gigantea]XP_028408444.1 voltage-dependent R-type calcium channel subunit alpha-1E-like [Dendronephthya gigantea]